MAWSAHAWTAPRLALAHAVYAKARKDSAYAPMSTPLGPGNVLLRSFDRQYIGQGTPATIAGQLVLESIKVRDAGLDQNRFSGMLPAAHGRPAVVPRRGGLYCSTDIRAAIAELFHYGQPNLSRHLIGQPQRLALFTHRCFVSMRAVGELSVVSLNSDAPAMLPYLHQLQADVQIAAALATAGYKDLFAALYDPQDYAAARGLGLGLEANQGIDGVQVISARDYETNAGHQRVLRTGDNVMLFGLDQQIAVDKVRITALHLVDPVPGGHELLVTHYSKAAGGQFSKAGADRFMP